MCAFIVIWWFFARILFNTDPVVQIISPLKLTIDTFSSFSVSSNDVDLLNIVILFEFCDPLLISTFISFEVSQIIYFLRCYQFFYVKIIIFLVEYFIAREFV